MILLLLAQAGGDVLSWLPAVAQLGLTGFLVVYLIMYANPRERREWQEALKAALLAQAAANKEVNKEKDDNWKQLIQVLTDARFEVLKELGDGLKENTSTTNDLVRKVNEGFDGCLKGLEEIKRKRGQT